MTNGTISPDPGDVQLVTIYLQTNQILVYSQFAFLSCLLYNIAATFSVEVEQIWRKKQSLHSVMYYLLRYIPLLCLGLGTWGNQNYDLKNWGNACTAWWLTEGILCTVVVQNLAEALMLMKVWALYCFSKRILAVLLVMFLGRITLGIWGGTNILAAHAFVVPPQLKARSDVPGCPFGPPPGVPAIEVSCAYNMVNSGIIFGLLLNQCIARHSVENQVLGTWKDLFGIRTAGPLIHILIRDGCVYFLMIFIAELYLFIVLFIRGSSLPITGFPLMQLAYSMPATSMALNIRDRDHDHAPGQGLKAEEINPISLIEFAGRHSSEIRTLDP